jgi:ubiquitin C-terminal hydrolase
MTLSMPSWFTLGRQQDASEYLRHLLNRLEEERSSIIEPLLQGKLQRTYTCGHCKEKTRREETFLDLPLSIPEDCSGSKVSVSGNFIEGEISVSTMLENCLKSSRFTGEDQLSCKVCGCLRDHTCTQVVLNKPEYLILTVNRFSYNSLRRGVDKNLQKMEIPEILELPTDELDTDREVYSLLAVVYHVGFTGDLGHYYTVAKRPYIINRADSDAATVTVGDAELEETWYKLDDTFVYKTSGPEAVSTLGAVHMIFYKKVDCY